jgi:hypothetical protein
MLRNIGIVKVTLVVDQIGKALTSPGLRPRVSVEPAGVEEAV